VSPDEILAGPRIIASKSSVTSNTVSENGHDDEFGEVLPPADRVWRHPAEIGALMAAANAAPVVTKRPWGVALFSALGGALAVAAVFVSIGQLDPDLIVVQERVAVQTITTEPRVVEPEQWAAEVGVPAQVSVAGITVQVDGETRTGSGILIRDDGHLVTTADLVAGADQVTVTLSDGAQVSGSVIGSDPVSALAVVQADASVAAAVRAESMDLQLGDPVAVVGSGRSTPTASRVVRVGATVVDRQARAHHDLAVLDAPLTPAQLGGAVVSDAGAVVGLASVVAGSTYDALVVPIEVVQSVASQIIDVGTVRHEAWLGVEVSDRDDGPGVDIEAVIFDGPGFDAGLRTGDVIAKLDGEAVTSADALVSRLHALGPGEAITLSVLRRDEKMEPTVTLGRRPLVTD